MDGQICKLERDRCEVMCNKSLRKSRWCHGCEKVLTELDLGVHLEVEAGDWQLKSMAWGELGGGAGAGGGVTGAGEGTSKLS